jgi:hypothetical protein
MSHCFAGAYHEGSGPQAKVKEDKADKSVRDLMYLLFEAALLTSGFTLDESGSFAKRIKFMAILWSTPPYPYDSTANLIHLRSSERMTIRSSRTGKPLQELESDMEYATHRLSYRASDRRDKFPFRLQLRYEDMYKAHDRLPIQRREPHSRLKASKTPMSDTLSSGCNVLNTMTRLILNLLGSQLRENDIPMMTHTTLLLSSLSLFVLPLFHIPDPSSLSLIF